MTRAMRRRLVAKLAFAAVAGVLLGASRSGACVGDACLQIWSTDPEGGALTIRYDFSQKIQTYESFCLSNRSQCFYSTIDPGFRAETEETHSGFHRLVDGTTLRVELVSADAGLTLSVNGQKLDQPGESASLGTMPTIHTHPAWQLLVPGSEFGDYRISYKLTTDSPRYAESEVFTSVVTNLAPPPTATPQPTATPLPCAGDCNVDRQVSVDELVRGVGMALGTIAMGSCDPLDANGGGRVGVEDLVRAVNVARDGCDAARPVSFTEVQDEIFTPRCAIPACHDAASANANLVLTEGRAYGALVGVPPDTESARVAGLLRVAAGEPERSFLLMKVQGPPPGQGSRMPLIGEPLTAEQIDLIRTWILQGALEQ
jgi:hypothetical protein